MFQPLIPGGPDRGDPELTDRQRAVLAAAVTLHEQSARPVGSDSLASASGIGLSSASLRAALAELEALGMLEKTRASSGRVPTARGYGYYVRRLVIPAVLAPGLLREVDETLRESALDVERLLREASRVLSSLTHQMGLALAASLEDERLAELDLTLLAAPRAVLVLHLGAQRVRTLLLELESPLERDALEEVAAVLRERLLGRRLREVRERLEGDPELVRHSAVRLVARAARRSWADSVSTPLFRAGARHIAEQPEFAARGGLGPVLDAVEDGRPLHRFMVSGIEGQAAVRVGLDAEQPLALLSLVSYALPGAVAGAVGVLGPRRMDYSVALAAVDAVGSRVADLLQA